MKASHPIDDSVYDESWCAHVSCAHAVTRSDSNVVHIVGFVSNILDHEVEPLPYFFSNPVATHGTLLLVLAKSHDQNIKMGLHLNKSCVGSCPSFWSQPNTWSLSRIRPIETKLGINTRKYLT